MDEHAEQVVTVGVTTGRLMMQVVLGEPAVQKLPLEVIS
jgi:hypothetical protein